jgi:hypothetical protein
VISLDGCLSGAKNAAERRKILESMMQIETDLLLVMLAK